MQVCIYLHILLGTFVCSDSLIPGFKESGPNIQDARLRGDFQCERHVLLLPYVHIRFKNSGLKSSNHFFLVFLNLESHMVKTTIKIWQRQSRTCCDPAKLSAMDLGSWI